MNTQQFCWVFLYLYYIEQMEYLIWLDLQKQI